MSRSLQRQGSIVLVEGLDVSKPAEYISSAASPNTQNFFLDRSILTKRAGTSVKGTALATEIMRGIEFIRENTSYNIRIGTAKVQLYTGGAWTNIGHADLTGNSDNLISLAIPLLSGKQILCMTNGVDVIRKYTGSGNTAALGGTPPKGKYIQEYGTYLVVANITGGTDVDTRVQWSDTAAPEIWSSGNAGSKDLVEDGGAITGMNLFSNYLCIHKQNSIYLGYLVNTTAIFRFERKATGAGTCANGSIVNLPTGEQVFLATDGIRVFNGIVTQLLDSPVNDEIRDSLNFEKMHKAWAVLVKELDEVWIGVPLGSQTRGETVYRFNYRTRFCYKDLRTNCNTAWRATQSSFITWDNANGIWDGQSDNWDDTALTSGTQLIFFGDTAGNVTYQDLLVNSDNGTAFTAFWETKDFQTDDKRICRWEELQLWARGGSVEVEYSTDGGNVWTPVMDSPFTLTDDFPTDESPLIIYFDVLSSRIRFRFKNSDGDETLGIKQYIIGYKPREFRR